MCLDDLTGQREAISFTSWFHPPFQGSGLQGTSTKCFAIVIIGLFDLFDWLFVPQLWDLSVCCTVLYFGLMINYDIRSSECCMAIDYWLTVFCEVHVGSVHISCAAKRYKYICIMLSTTYRIVSIVWLKQCSLVEESSVNYTNVV